jgi:predicted nucleotidyltransferase
MKLEQALLTLRNAEPALRAKGVCHAAIFGSTARGDQRTVSDIDILVDLDPSANVTVYDYVAIRNDIAALFEDPVDVIDREGLKPHLRQPVAQDLVYAF